MKSVRVPSSNKLQRLDCIAGYLNSSPKIVAGRHFPFYSYTNFELIWLSHYGDVIMGAIASQITSFTIVFWTVYSDADQRKYQSSVSLAFVRGIHRSSVNSPHKWPVTRILLSFYDVIMWNAGSAHVWNAKLVIVFLVYVQTPGGLSADYKTMHGFVISFWPLVISAVWGTSHWL